MANREKVVRTTDETIVDFLQLIKSTNRNWLDILHRDSAGDVLILKTQHQILSIFFYALLEWLVEYQKQRPRIDDATIEGLAQMDALAICDLHEKTALELCSIFTTDEHMVMTYLRHYLVHGHVTAFFDHPLQTFEIKAGKVVKGWSKPADTNDRRAKVTELFGGLEPTFEHFFQRFVEFPAMHWANLNAVSRAVVIDELELCVVTNSADYTPDTVNAIAGLGPLSYLPEPPRVSIITMQQRAVARRG
ncbi:hypothetical protein HJB86_10485 [Rhizobium sp. NZLR3b]|uniref:hypothetical protein n=1 Tax=Rhizobium sp. NZLR3b TaxID=2731101 RepID=UPI001C8352DE|nr:hypothetical protein [Rhizobium sp. NZLR3b]MBX5189329.1 hypothetical protein [Rhizobium sp. NZLR3b]